MDGPLVYLLSCQAHGRVAKSGRDKRLKASKREAPLKMRYPIRKE